MAWSDYWVKTPLSRKGNKNAPVLFNVHNSEDALLRPHAVRLDGASDWRIFHQVVLPMSAIPSPRSPSSPSCGTGRTTSGRSS